jgi:hypothetical protein
MLKRQWILAVFALFVLLAPARFMLGQADQGTITGVIQDPSGAVIGNANVTLTSEDTGQVLKSKADGSGVFVFTPIKIGNYKLTAGAPGFESTTQTNLHLSIQQHLNIPVMLKPGSTIETITVTTDAPLMQTQESSVGQTMDTETINSVPLAGRNWVYIAQLSAGTAVSEGSRGSGKGDFEANGQRAEENNFILDGVDNNANVVDFYNGASFVVNPPPDALAEFKVQTSSYSAEFGHSAGAVVNASIKSGSNKLHGSAWEYVRNTIFDVPSWDDNTKTTPAYHENQFGATLGGPVLKNKVFLFGDTQATRIVSHVSQTINVPTDKERIGDFSDLLNQSTLGGAPLQLYTQDPTGVAAPAKILNNCMSVASNCGTSANLTLNPTALKMLSLYPEAKTQNSLAANYTALYPVIDNTFQWDMRADWTIGAKDTTYSRYSYSNQVGENWSAGTLLGPILDGGGFGAGKNKNYGGNFMWSETHVFTNTLTNEARFGFNYLHSGFQQSNAADATSASDTFAASQGFGGIPGGPLNGGLPNTTFNGTSAPQTFGATEWGATDEHENVYQILDNVTKIWGNHSLKAGVSFQNIRFATLQPQVPRGEYDYRAPETSNPNIANTGYSVASFLLDRQDRYAISNSVVDHDQRSANALYFQDDWRLNQKLTVNFGLRWEDFQPYKERDGLQANFYITQASFNASAGAASGTGVYAVPTASQSKASPIITSNGFDKALASENINLVWDSNSRLATQQHTNFAPRLGLAYSPDGKTAIRLGYGIFYGGLESLGYWGNLGENYPFQVSSNPPAAGCNAALTYCASDGITIANGFTNVLAQGFASQVIGLALRGEDHNQITPYTESWNLSVERGITNDVVATASYVANESHHLQDNTDPDGQLALTNGNASINGLLARPMHGYQTAFTSNIGYSNYQSLQTKLEKRMSHGYNLLATYTWSHALDAARTPLGSDGDADFRAPVLIPIKYDYSNSPFDTRHRLTFNALYQLPLGKGKAFLNNSKVLDLVAGGWSINALYTAQTGSFFSVKNSLSSQTGGFYNNPSAVRVADEFATGGTAGPGQTCATSTKNRTHWFNPCSFANPWDGTDATLANGAANPHYIPTSGSGAFVTDFASIMGYAGGRRNTAKGPGLERANTSIFKEFTAYHENKLEFRADIFNLFNTVSLYIPSDTSNDSNGGQITAHRNLQRYAPDSRFMQLSLRYSF